MLISQLHNREHDKKTLVDLMNIMPHYVLALIWRGFPLVVTDHKQNTCTVSVIEQVDSRRVGTSS